MLQHHLVFNIDVQCIDLFRTYTLIGPLLCAHSVCALYSQVGVVFVGFSIAVVLGLGVDVELVFGTVVVDVGELHARAEDVIA